METPKVVETFHVGVWLSNSVPEFMVSRVRYEQALKRTWRKEDRLEARWAPEDGREEGSVYEATVIGAKAPDRVTGLLPWAALQTEWDSGEADFLNPWCVNVLGEEGGQVVPEGKVEYHGLYDVYKHHHSLLDRPRVGGREGGATEEEAQAQAQATAYYAYQQQQGYGYPYPHHQQHAYPQHGAAAAAAAAGQGGRLPPPADAAAAAAAAAAAGYPGYSPYGYNHYPGYGYGAPPPPPGGEGYGYR